MRRLATTIIPILLLAPSLLVAQGVGAESTLTIAPGDSVVNLGHLFIVDGTLRILDESGGELDTTLYRLHATSGNLYLSTPFVDSLLFRDDTLRFTASYSYLPLSLPQTIALREIRVETDSAGRERTVLSGGAEPPLTASSIFGPSFQRSGSITRGVTLGTNRDLTVQSGLRLQFRGMVAEDVEVIGSLTDEETPIQAEGNTRTLREVDNIFFEIRSPVADGTLGLFYAEERGSEYTRFRRKLQGVRALGKFGAAGSTQVVAALSPGNFRSQEFTGREGDQGPYRLTGENGERDIVVLAGTERVFVDGVEMIRGREFDYVIDYGTGEVTFQPQRPITGFNEISVDFEYTTRRYSRSFLAASHNGTTLDSTLDFHLSWVREGDDPDAPLDLEYGEEDLRLLAEAGSDPNGAVRSGVRFVGRSDTASGFYRAIDTVVEGVATEIYRYDPSSREALYDVTFSRAPDGRGDYRNVAFGRYDYVGPGLGEYLPVTYLPLPAIQQVAALGLRFRPTGATSIEAEVALSGVDRNRLSRREETSQSGLALKLQGGAADDSVTVAGIAIGGLSARTSLRYLDAEFEPVGRIGDPEFARIWNAESRLGSSGFDDIIAETEIGWRPERGLDLSATIGRLVRGDFFTSTRQEYTLLFRRPERRFSGDAAVAVIDSRDSVRGGIIGDWTKVATGMAYRLGRLTPGLRGAWQQKEERHRETDTLKRASFRFLEAGPDLLLDFPSFRTALSSRVRFDDSVRYDAQVGRSRFRPDSRSITHALRGSLLGVRALRSTIDFTWRTRRFDSVPGEIVAIRLDNSTILARSETTWTPFDRGVELDLVYDVQTEQAARLQRLFIQVPIGQGGYVWVDLDSNGLQSEFEFRETNAGDGEYVRVNLPTEQLFPVVDLDADIRLRVDPSRFLDPSSGAGSLLRGVVTETTLRLEEKSNTENESAIYLLQLSEFFDDSTTILGNALFQNDLFLFEDRRDVNIRLRLTTREGVTRLFSGVERSDALERSARVRWFPTKDIGLEVTGALIERSLLGDALDASRAYDLDISELASDFSYRPERALELGWVFRLRAADDAVTAGPRSTTLTGNELRGVYSIETKGRLRATLERTVVEGVGVEEGEIFSLPFQLTDGYGIGTTWVGRLSFDYRFGANIQATLSYTGRADPPSNRVIHTGGAEVRAFF